MQDGISQPSFDSKEGMIESKEVVVGTPKKRDGPLHAPETTKPSNIKRPSKKASPRLNLPEIHSSQEALSKHF